MDPVINSLVQSPLVRSLSTVPSKSSSFVHGLRDNIPPFSFKKVEVAPDVRSYEKSAHSWNGQRGSHTFSIPQYGTLNRAYLKIKMVSPRIKYSAVAKLTQANIDVTLNDLRETGVSGKSIQRAIIRNPSEFGMHLNAVKYQDNIDNLLETSSGLNIAIDFVRGYDTTNNTAGQAAVKLKPPRIPWIHWSNYYGKTDETTPLGSGGGQLLRMYCGDRSKYFTSTNNQPFYHFSDDMVKRSPENLYGNASSSWNALMCIEKMILKTSRGEVENIPAECIASEVMKMPSGLKDFFEKGMVGFTGGSATMTRLYDPSCCCKTNDGIYLGNGFGTSYDYFENTEGAVFYVPVPLSSLKHLSKNYQTRFVENLMLEVQMKPFQQGFEHILETEFDDTAEYLPNYDVTLNLIYHNWTDNIEHAIRNSNYKRGIPASIFSTSWTNGISGGARMVETKADYLKKEQIPNTVVVTGATVSSSYDKAVILKLSQIPNLASEIFVSIKHVQEFFEDGFNTTGVYAASAHTYTQTAYIGGKRPASPYCISRDGLEKHFDVELWGSGQLIWKANTFELAGPDSADYDLTDRRGMFTDLSHGAPRRIMTQPFLGNNKVCGMDLYVDDDDPDESADKLGTKTKFRFDSDIVLPSKPTQGGIQLGFGDSCFSMRFGMSTTDEFYSGGLALSTLSSPYLLIRPMNQQNAITTVPSVSSVVLNDPNGTLPTNTTAIPGDNRAVSNFQFATQSQLNRLPFSSEFDRLQFTAYVKYMCLTRIDSDTGMVQKTLDV